MTIAPPEKKSTPSFPATPIKVEVLSSPPFFIWLQAHLPPAERGEGAHYVTLAEIDKLRLES